MNFSVRLMYHLRKGPHWRSFRLAVARAPFFGAAGPPLGLFAAWPRGLIRSRLLSDLALVPSRECPPDRAVTRRLIQLLAILHE